MAYNYFPTSYNPFPGYVPQAPVQAPPAPSQTAQVNSGIVWVQGETGAKAYPVAPNTTVLLMDSEGDRFFLKSSDASGVPLPLRIFDYKEQKGAPAPAPTAEYATKKDIEDLRKRIDALSVKEATDNE